MNDGTKNRNFNISINYDNECKVFIGTSEDIPGLVLEAEKLGELFDAAREVVPSLLEHNLKIPQDGSIEVAINMHLLVPEPKVNARCKYTFEQEAAVA